ncbi:MAG: FkbM family methyltransferase [Ferruginibacter sp.]
MKQLPIEDWKTFEDLLTPESTCIDVGAHGGAWTVPLSKRCTKGTVYAIEALPYYADVLRITLSLLFRTRNVKLFNNAVSDKAGVVSLRYKDKKGRLLTGMTHVSSSGKEQDTIDVECLSLDQFAEKERIEKLDFIKIDVEGFELFVLRGASTILKKFKPAVYCEIMSKWTERYQYQPADIFKFMTDTGYKIYYINKNKKLEFFAQNETVLPSQNFLFIHPESGK